MKVFASLITALLLFGCYSKKPSKITTGLEGKPMPAIELVALDSTHFNTKNIKPGRPSILLAFSPTCPYCRAQTRSIVSNINSLKGIDIYMVCINQYSLLKKFSDQYELNKYSNIKIGIDYNESFLDYYKATNVPYLAIYDKKKDLKQVLMGKNYVSTLKKVALN
jgi:thiol-disulfide isomerase/thioredoxin